MALRYSELIVLNQIIDSNKALELKNSEKNNNKGEEDGQEYPIGICGRTVCLEINQNGKCIANAIRGKTKDTCSLERVVVDWFRDNLYDETNDNQTMTIQTYTEMILSKEHNICIWCHPNFNNTG